MIRIIRTGSVLDVLGRVLGYALSSLWQAFLDASPETHLGLAAVGMWLFWRWAYSFLQLDNKRTRF